MVSHPIQDINVKTTETLLRQWCMLRDIPRRPRKITASALHAKLLAAGYSVDIRTVQRDLINLSRELSLCSDNGKPQGWAWMEDAPQLDFPALEPQAARCFIWPSAT